MNETIWCANHHPHTHTHLRTHYCYFSNHFFLIMQNKHLSFLVWMVASPKLMWVHTKLRYPSLHRMKTKKNLLPCKSNLSVSKHSFFKRSIRFIPNPYRAANLCRFEFPFVSDNNNNNHFSLVHSFILVKILLQSNPLTDGSARFDRTHNFCVIFCHFVIPFAWAYLIPYFFFTCTVYIRANILRPTWIVHATRVDELPMMNIKFYIMPLSKFWIHFYDGPIFMKNNSHNNHYHHYWNGQTITHAD